MAFRFFPPSWNGFTSCKTFQFLNNPRNNDRTSIEKNTFCSKREGLRILKILFLNAVYSKSLEYETVFTDLYFNTFFVVFFLFIKIIKNRTPIKSLVFSKLKIVEVRRRFWNEQRFPVVNHILSKKINFFFCIHRRCDVH